MNCGPSTPTFSAKRRRPDTRSGWYGGSPGACRPWPRATCRNAPADLAAWRQWLKERYGGDAALRRAWNDAEVTCGSAAVPTPAARRAAPAGVFRDPAAERPLIDWAEFQQQAMADCVCHMAHAVRSASAGRKLVVFFYGYVFEFGAVPNGPATAGHYALRRVLNCPDIDVLCAPISYFDRGLGQGAPSMRGSEEVVPDVTVPVRQDAVPLELVVSVEEPLQIGKTLGMEVAKPADSHAALLQARQADGKGQAPTPVFLKDRAMVRAAHGPLDRAEGTVGLANLKMNRLGCDRAPLVFVAISIRVAGLQYDPTHIGNIGAVVR